MLDTTNGFQILRQLCRYDDPPLDGPLLFHAAASNACNTLELREWHLSIHTWLLNSPGQNEGRKRGEPAVGANSVSPSLSESEASHFDSTATGLVTGSKGQETEKNASNHLLTIDGVTEASSAVNYPAVTHQLTSNCLRGSGFGRRRVACLVPCVMHPDLQERF